ncbi:MAG: FAD/NAD(P)-binding protein, partial [Planctomycetota bacterium]|nr:FAD/NAD(P)-binding protein [Planctomycetota bacterium]
MTAFKIIIVGSGVAGSEAGTFLAENTEVPVEIIEIESEPVRRFGGWGFQKFPGENTNLAMRKMYLGEDPDDIFQWAKTVAEYEFHPDQTIPRAFMQDYVR